VVDSADDALTWRRRPIDRVSRNGRRDAGRATAPRIANVRRAFRRRLARSTGNAGCSCRASAISG